MTGKRPIAVDLFAGAGGMSLGFEQAGFDVLAAVEVDPIHCAVHDFNFPNSSIFCRSVVDTSPEEIRNGSAIAQRDIDVVFGGPPCQGFSLMGKRAIEDARNALVFHFVRLVIELQPRYFVMENVPGMATGKSKQLLLETIAKFQAHGYQVRETYQILNAARYGVPQNRDRLFLLGCRQGLSLPDYPSVRSRPAGTDASLLDASLSPGPSVWDALQDLPCIENHPELLQTDSTVAEFGTPSAYGNVLRGRGRDLENFGYDRIFDRSRLTSSLRTRHTQVSIERFAATLPGKIEPVSRFLKLDPDGICNTLRAGTPSSRGAHTSPRPIHPFVPRCITVREAARLHSYPDWFRFHTTKWHGFRQVGNSVPPLLARAIAAEILTALGRTPQKPETVLPLGNEAWLRFDMSHATRHYKIAARPIASRRSRSAKNQVPTVAR